MPASRILVVLLPLALVAGCANAAEEIGSDSSNVETTPSSRASLFEGGFSVVTQPGCSDDLTGSGCNVAILDSAGRAVGEDSPLLVASLRPLDRETVGSYTVFRWPKTIPSTDHDAVGELMREYSKLVGTLLHRDAEGPGEQSWASYKRSEQFSAVRDAAAGGPRAMCEQVVKSFVDDLVPEGSKHLQYGNCGEGGHIGACLSLKAGFAADDIRVCASRNDHFFAMVKHPTKKWCILDRWPLVNNDNYACDVDFDADQETITYQGKAMEQDWFQKVNCISFAAYVADPESL